MNEDTYLKGTQFSRVLYYTLIRNKLIRNFGPNVQTFIDDN